MRLVVAVCFFSLCFTLRPGLVLAQAEQPSDRQLLARDYAEVVGRLALVDWLITALGDRCGVDIALPSQSYSAIDYALRMQTNVSFFQWRKQFSDPAEEAKLVKQLIAKTLHDIGGCDDDAVLEWFRDTEQNILEPSIARLSAMPDFLGLSMDKPDEEQLAKVFTHQLVHYNELSLAELRGLASALKSGIYRYSMSVFSNNVPKDAKRAVLLREYIYAQSASVSDLYELADTLRFTDKERAVSLFSEAAGQGNFFAQRWYGNYLACRGKKREALKWLEKAKQSDPEQTDFINDFIVEINELGEPTNCIDGWPE